MRLTSLEAFEQIKKDGTLSKLRMKVYEYIVKEGPCTQREAIQTLSRFDVEANGSYSSRFSELERLGVISVIRDTISPSSGKRVSVYATTGNLPKGKARVTKQNPTAEDSIEYKALNSVYEKCKEENENLKELIKGIVNGFIKGGGINLELYKKLKEYL